MRTNIVIDDKLMRDAMRATRHQDQPRDGRVRLESLAASGQAEGHRCIEYGYELLHNDRDFEPFVTHLGLREVN